MHDGEALASAIREEIAALRAGECVPAEVRLDSARWRLLTPHMTIGAYGGRRTFLFEGVKCALAVRLPEPGYRVRYVRVE